MYTHIQTSDINFTGLLGLLFIGLKLGGVIEWAWAWVLFPLWFPLFVLLILIVIILLVVGVAHVFGVK